MKDFFTSIPGILVISGAVLLIISIILFFIGLKKNKTGKTNNIDNTQIENDKNEIKEEIVSTIDIDKIADNMVNEIEAKKEEENKQENENEDNLPKENVSQEEVKEENKIENDIKEDNKQETNNETETVPLEPVIDNSTTDFDFTLPEEEPIVINEEAADSNVIDIPTEIPTTEHQAYGGNEPVVDFKLPEEDHKTIYGGNDPLEKTQNIKPITDIQSQPYGIEPDVTVVDEKKEEEIPAIEPYVINEDNFKTEEQVNNDNVNDNSNVEEL